MEVNFLLNEIETAAKKLLAETGDYKVVAFHGEMGAGKTTLIHSICKVMGVEDVVSSPTFSIINEYKTKQGQTVYHMDLYRIKDENEAINAGVEDCLYSGNICLVEWPDKAANILPDNTLHLYLTSIADNTRKLKINL